MPDRCNCRDCTEERADDPDGSESETPLGDELHRLADEVRRVERQSGADDISLSFHGTGPLHVDLEYETDV